MNKLSLKLLGVDKLKPNVYVDGKRIKYKKNKYGAIECQCECANPEAEVVITKQSELASKWWLLMNILFFVISIFGIFEPPYDSKGIMVNCKFVVSMAADTSVTVQVNSLTSTGTFANINSTSTIREISNSYLVDKTIKRRWRIQAALRFFLFIAAAIGILLLVI